MIYRSLFREIKELVEADLSLEHEIIEKNISLEAELQTVRRELRTVKRMLRRLIKEKGV
jgi:phosphoenolpyruvate synthase/pyruvate phosphate dikinase